MKKLWTRISSSTFLWTVLFLAATNHAAGLLHPLKAVPHSQIPALQLSESALKYKFDQLNKLPKPPSVMLLGSSLPMCAFYYSEGDQLSKAIVSETDSHGLNLIQSYPEANYFRSQIQRKFGKEPDVFNFTTAACMPSDARLLLSRITDNKKQPSILIYGVGLRDFVDNINPPPGETPAFKALCDARYLVGNASIVPKPEARTALALSSLSEVYRLRDQFHLMIESWLCRDLKRQTNMERAFSLIAMERDAKAKTTPIVAASQVPAPTQKVTDLRPKAKTQRAVVAVQPAKPKLSSNLAVLDYPTRYNPPNYNRLQQEMSELTKIVDLCKQNKTTLVLVNMPVSDGNKTLSTPGLREKYLSDLKSICSKNAVPLVDFETVKIFEERDFLDTVHMSGYGAKKMIEELLTQMQQRGLTSISQN